MPSSPKVPLTVDVTNAGLPAGTDVYMYVVGLVSAPTGLTFYRLDAHGVPQAMSPKDNTQKAGEFPGSSTLPAAAVTALAANYPLAWADYSIPVSLTGPTTLDLANINSTHCPGLGTGTAAFSGRVYISIGVPRLPFTSVTGGYTAPVPFAGGPGALTLFDWIEFSYDSHGNFNGNTTQVDQFGFELHLNGTPGGTLQGKLNTARADIMNAFGPAAKGPFGGGVLQVPVPAAAAPAYPAGTSLLRVVSPKTLTAPASYTGPLNTYFDDVIAGWYKAWEKTPVVTHDTSTGYYSGMVVNGVLTFKHGNYASAEGYGAAPAAGSFTVAGSGRIPTADVWQCANSLATGTPAQLNVQKILAAAFNRGAVGPLLDDRTCAQNVKSFYPSGGTWNVWADTFHRFSENHLAYGFPYDDVCNQNPSISLAGTRSVTIALGPFGAKHAAQPHGAKHADPPHGAESMRQTAVAEPA